MSLKICDFTQSELDYLSAMCNFTKDETTLFGLRAKDTPLEQCAEIMCVSIDTVKRISRKVNSKIQREM